MRNLAILITIFISFMLWSESAKSVEVNSLYFEAEDTFGPNRQYYLPQDSVPKNNFNLGLDLDLTAGLNILYLNNLISTTVDQSQFRYAALDMEFGLNTTLGFQVYVRHYSGHILDATDPFGDRFPQENVVGIRFHIIGEYR